MRVGMYYSNSDVRVEEIPMPKIGPGELLVKVAASGICGSDVMEWYRVKTAPRVLGHEITGEIVEVGEKVKGYKVGGRVFVSHHVPCNTCKYCSDGHHTACDTLHRTNFDPGGFSEFIRIPEINVDRGTYVLPDELSYEDGVFIEPLGCVVRGQRLARLEPGHSVLIIGSGISGLLHIQLAIAAGAKQVIATDIDESRLNAAKKFGADAVHAAEDVPGYLRQVNDGRLADRVILCTGAGSAIDQALNCADRGGVVQLFAPSSPGVETPVNLNHLWNNQITLVSTYGAAPVDLEESIEIIRSRRVNVRDMITHRLKLEEIQAGFQLVVDAKESIKVIIKP